MPRKRSSEQPLAFLRFARARQLPWLVGNCIEILDIGEDSDEDDEGGGDASGKVKGKSCVVRTSTRQTIYLPVPGLVNPDTLRPGDLVGTNKDSYLILDKLPTEFDSRVKVRLMPSLACSLPL